MAIAGIVGLVVAFAAIVVSIGAFLVERMVAGAAEAADYQRLAGRVALGGQIAVLLTSLALSFCGILLLFCFLTGDSSLEYVVRQHSDATGPLAVLYRISGLWGGRQGSLLLWVWLIALFAALIAIRNLKKREALDNMALLIIQFVILGFVAVLLFSEDNMPFMPLDPQYFDASGQLKSFEQLMLESSGAAAGSLEPSLVLGMNVLLEHWAMAIHPPTLFIGYAGLIVPFAYALAALIVNDPSKRWVIRARRYALFSWVFLGLGIGLGALWAYVVLGWGGYWGWDPVENASLLSWLLAVALVHSLTVYRQRGDFKRWSVMCACLAFCFVIVGTFITRSGIVQNSVHAFAGDQVSLVMFLTLIIASVLAGVIGLAVRWKSFGAASADADAEDSLFSRAAAYYFNNVILVLSAFLVLYLTLASALPSWMPYGGMSLSASTYNAIARPLGILYCLLMAVCPMLSWAKTQGKEFWRRARLPGACALVLFALLVAYFFVSLKPAYDATLAAGGAAATTLLEGGAPFYYFTITIVGFLAASLLLMNSLFMLGRLVKGLAREAPIKASHPTELSRFAPSSSAGVPGSAPDSESICPRSVWASDATTCGNGGDCPDRAGANWPEDGRAMINRRFPRARGANPAAALLVALRERASLFGGFLAHLSMAVILVGLIGSSMYVSSASDYLPFDEQSDTAGKDFVIGEYRLAFVKSDIVPEDNGADVVYSVTFDAWRGESYLGQMTPGIFFVEANQQRKPLAAVLSSPLEDLFVVYNGTGTGGELSLSAFINPCVSFIWVGFGLLMLGTAIATLG
ncbi:MAG: cytochrome c biogenesis protein CcsA, partial [Coriobacteriales bacterium]|nr:cytochrome c biogenesis protein CcsA [Coriobacteriales bacterium]